QEINGTLQLIRDKADIWGAVLIVDALGDDSIESLAERAFNKWGLGQRGKDNGLLLVLAMNDRKSRFEVGYGLEGDLPDAIARRALDDVLRPYMRQGDVKTAVVKAFSYLAGVKSKDPVFESDLTDARIAAEQEEAGEDDLDPAGGWRGFIPYLLCLWFLDPIVKLRNLRRARRLAASHPLYRVEDDEALNHGKLGWKYLIFGKEGSAAFILKPFFSLNPGCFVWVGSALHPLGYAGAWVLTALVGLPYFLRSGKRYVSTESYEAWIEKERQSNQKMVDKGYKKEVRPGVFEFTPSWYASSEYKSSRSSSSSSSSSSGGGRSGGGGSSSSW
ncbi:MAG TPA: TPM domain-containing protein, partial [Burkholderiales bacterium]|nr:TPM domain-containing protein [Burkholderiales bacterium]